MNPQRWHPQRGHPQRWHPQRWHPQRHPNGTPNGIRTRAATLKGWRHGNNAHCISTGESQVSAEKNCFVLVMGVKWALAVGLFEAGAQQKFDNPLWSRLPTMWTVHRLTMDQ